MFMTVAKILLIGFWLVGLLNFVMPFPHPVNWIVGGLFCFLLMMHGFQLLIFRSMPVVKPHLRPGDSWRILVFGVLPLWEIKKRLEQSQARS